MEDQKYFDLTIGRMWWDLISRLGQSNWVTSWHECTNSETNTPLVTSFLRLHLNILIFLHIIFKNKDRFLNIKILNL